ncbi:two-component regulator propeller domain-containing protein [Brumicola nitratireducens]|uniref:Sensory/regulatory protein RpfC n=1 Tax=Glaciecola nitratireducens (strain JCM 12485 / KCTC 12276 / FR1064) TaxID=1085623 RepID=G4QDY1_GLANF|nr:two-component regulator propeller domain-containing protein [Glaciecola nitratireducens]AEP31255.1 Hpt sensor hybrid histidine kinase [Glaciecola nitratireducens FR1064]
MPWISISLLFIGLLVTQTIEAKLFYEKVSRDVSFSTLNERHELSGPVVNDIEQDIQGFIWIATQNGLNKYDGQKVTHYLHNPDDENSLPGSWIVDIFSDREGNLWVAGESGVSLYLPEIDGFHNFTGQEDDIIQGLKFTVIAQVEEDKIWFGTKNNGIVIFDIVTSKFIERINTQAGLQSDYVRDIAVDELQNVFVATNDRGLFYRPAGQNNFTVFNSDSEIKLPFDNISSILIDSQKRIWLGSINSGLLLFNVVDGVQKRFLSSSGIKSNVCSNSINDIFQDSDGYIYIATESDGLCEWDDSNKSFIHYVNNKSNDASLSDDRVLSLFQDRGGVLWVGTAVGISKWNRSLNSFQLVNTTTPTGKNLSSDTISSFAEAENGDLYVGTWGEGINVIDINESIISHIRAEPGVEGALQDGRITTMLIDSQQNLWVGTLRDGLHLRRKNSDKFILFQNDPEDDSTISSNLISKIIEIGNGNLAIGTYGGGINILNSSGNIQRFAHDANDAKSLSNNRITHLVEGRDNTIWVATRGGGLNQFDLATKEFMKVPLESQEIWSVLLTENNLWFATADKGVGRISKVDLDNEKFVFEYTGYNQGLASNFAYGLLADENGYIWVSTAKGLSFISLENNRVKNFNTSHGLQGTDFNNIAFFQGQDGRMFFGGANGFNTFLSKTVPVNLYKPPIVLTEYRRLNELIPIHRAFNSEGNIELDFDEANFGFSFAALDFTRPDFNRYQYRSSGDDSDWINLGNSNQVNFPYLTDGYYVIQVRGSNNDGIWSEEILEIPVLVNPPIYRSSIAYLTYFWIIVFIAYRLFTMAHRKKLKQIAHSLELEKEVSLRTSELELANNQLAVAVEETSKAKDLAIKAAQAKSNFLAIVSHEIRTPMNSIIGMSELLLTSELNENQKRYANAVSRAGESLLTLINDILDLSKIESDKIELENQEFDFHALIEELLFLFSVRASEKDLELGYSIATECPRYIMGDAHRLRQVVSNLLNNAIKFTSKGSINLEVHYVNKEIQISVIDTGIGIEKEHFEKIFNEFQQADSTTTRNFGGTGLGLSITRKIIDQMSAKIEVESALGKGTTFTVHLPVILPLKKHVMVSKVEDLSMRPILLVCSNNTAAKMMQNTFERLHVSALLTTIDELRIDSFPATNALIFIDHADFLLNRAFISTTLDITDYCVLLRTTEKADAVNEFGLRRIEKPIRLETVRAEILFASNAEEEMFENTTEVSALSEHNSRFSAKILLVEDVVANQDVAVTMLEMFGCEVDIAGNGQLAVDLTQKNRYDLIFMDLHMPVMDGLTATCIIRENEKSTAQSSAVPIIALTAGVFDEEKGLCLEIGMNDFMLKPFNASQLFSMIAEHIPEKQIKISSLDIPASVVPNKTIELDNWIDADAVESIREIEVRTGKKLYLRVADSFTTVMAEQMPALLEACKSNDRTTAMELAHAMKSLSGNVGTMVFTQLLLAIETAAKSNQPIDDAEKLEELEDVFENSLKSLHILVEKMYD